MKIRHKNNIDETLAKVKKHLKDDMIISIEPVGKGATTLQKRYYWAVIISEIEKGENGELINELMESRLSQLGAKRTNYIHEYLKQMFAPIKDEQVVGLSSMSTIEIENYMSKCRQYASVALSIYIPLPNESGYIF